MGSLIRTNDQGSKLCSGVGPHISGQVLVIPAPFAADTACGNCWIEVIGHEASDRSIGFSVTWQVFFAYDGTTLLIKRVQEIAPFYADPTLAGLGFPGVALAPVVTATDEGDPALAVAFGGVLWLDVDIDVSYDKLQVGGS